MINKAQLAINANDLTLELGSKPNYTGSISGLVNGDEQYESIFGITDTKLEWLVGNHVDVIGIVIDGKVYTDVGNWTQGSFWKNYDISVEAGSLEVKQTIPGYNPNEPIGPGNNPFWHAQDKYGWLNNPEERERKAEIHFVDGGQVFGEEV